MMQLGQDRVFVEFRRGSRFRPFSIKSSLHRVAFITPARQEDLF